MCLNYFFIMNILFVGSRDHRHSSAGGYDKIALYPGANSLSDKDVIFGSIPVGTRGKCINVFFRDIYARFLRNRYDIVHFFYGDTILLPYRHSRKHKIVATIHLDVAQHNRLPSLFIKALKSIDGVVVLGSHQAEVLRKQYSINAVFIPHGFSKPEFTLVDLEPLNHISMDDYVNIFVSGTNYRDMDLLQKSIEYLEGCRKNVFFHVVGQTSAMIRKLNMFKNVFCYPRLSDDEYFTLLSRCDYNFLPLTFATANNALLEAQFLGVKSILPEIPGITDYAAPYPKNLFYNSFNHLKEVLLSINKEQISTDIIKFSERFLWANIYNKLANYYFNIMKL